MKRKANIYDTDDVERSKRLLFSPEERAARAKHKAEVLGTKLERAKKKSAETAQGLKEEIARLSEEMGGFQEILKVQQEKAGMVKSRRYVRSLRMLHRNPGAVSKIYREALEEIRGKSGIVSRIKRKNGRGGGTCQ